jgi:hypothetical protein
MEQAVQQSPTKRDLPPSWTDALKDQRSPGAGSQADVEARYPARLIPDCFSRSDATPSSRQAA